MTSDSRNIMMMMTYVMQSSVTLDGDVGRGRVGKNGIYKYSLEKACLWTSHLIFSVIVPFHTLCY